MQCLVAAALCLSLVNGQGFPVALSPGGPPPVNPSNSVMTSPHHGQNFALPPPGGQPTAPPQHQPQHQPQQQQPHHQQLPQQPQQQPQQQQQQQQQQQGYNPMMPTQQTQYKPMQPQQYNPQYMYNQPPQIPNAFQQYQTNPMPNNNLAWPRPPQKGYGMQNSGWGMPNSGWGAQNPGMMRGQGQRNQNNNMDQMSNLMLLGGNSDAFWDLQSMRMFGPMGLMMDIPQEMMWLGMGNNRGQGGGMGMGQRSGSNNMAATLGLMHLLN